jgi:hypothetical protein
MMDFNLTLDDEPSPSESRGVNYLVSSEVSDVEDELRFVWVQKLTRDYPGEEHGDGSEDVGSSRTSRPGAHTGYSKQGRHQENFSATKYIKP